MKARLQRIGKWVGYPVFFLFSFLLFAYWTFPYERVRDFIVQEVERPIGPGGQRVPSGYALEIVGLSPSWITGVDLTGVQLTKLPTTPEERPTDVTFEHVHARIGLFALLTGTVAVSFDAAVAGGTLEGEVEQSEEQLDLELEIENVNLRRIGLLRSYTVLPLGGSLTGTVDLSISEDPSKTSGNVDLRLAGMSLGDGNAKIMGLTLDRIVGGDLALQAEVENGSAQIKKLEARGQDLELDGAGAITFALPIARSRLDNVMIRAKITDAYKERSERARTIFEILQMRPEVRSAFTQDGALQFRLNGSFERIIPQPAGRMPFPGR